MGKLPREVEEENRLREICAQRVWELAMIVDLSPTETKDLAHSMALKLTRSRQGARLFGEEEI